MSAVENLPAPTTVHATSKVGSSGRDQTTGTDHPADDTHTMSVGSGPPSAPAATMAAPKPSLGTSRRDADLLLYLFADQLDDVESLRIATENRLRTLFSDEDWGKGVPSDLPEAQALTSQLEQIKAVEHGVTLSLKRAMRAHYLGHWCKATVGVGEKQLGRLLAAIGDPATRERPSQLWAFCGLHVLHPGQQQPGTHVRSAGVEPSSDPAHARTDTQARGGGVAPTRTRGQKANWSTDARSRVILVAESCIKAGVRKLPGRDDTDGYDHAHRKAITPYGQVYLDGRIHYANAVHRQPCRQCGPKGKPAEPGSPLSDGHKHARARRLVAKGRNGHPGILLDLWKQARGDT